MTDLPHDAPESSNLADRRTRLMRLHLMGMSLREIAEAEGVSVATIRRDLQAARQDMLNALAPRAVGQAVAEAFQVLQEAREQAFREAALAESATAKATLFQTALRANERLWVLLQDLQGRPRPPSRWRWKCWTIPPSRC